MEQIIQKTNVRTHHEKPPVAGAQKIVIVLPAYNEGQGLINLLHRTVETFEATPVNYSIVVVDDGSVDGTYSNVREFAEKAPVKLLKNEANMGLGKTLKRGIYFAMEQCDDNDIIVTMDGDDTHPPSSIDEMVSLINKGFDVVIASRFRKNATISGLSPTREWLSGMGRFLFIGLIPIQGVRDFTCGFRAFRVAALRSAAKDFGDRFMTETGFTVTADLLLRLRGRGLKFAEVPLHLSYENKTCPSKMRVIKTTWQTLLLILKRRLGR